MYLLILYVPVHLQLKEAKENDHPSLLFCIEECFMVYPFFFTRFIKKLHFTFVRNPFKVNCPVEANVSLPTPAFPIYKKL